MPRRWNGSASWVFRRSTSRTEADADTIAVIRAHGVTPQVQRDLEGRAAKVIDATCPFVTRVQHLAERAAKDGRDVVVAGNPDHPEMIGVVGYAPDNTYVVRDASEVASLPQLRSPLVVSQTTIKLKTFLEVAEAVRAKADAEPQVVNTICSATRDRQDAARALAGASRCFLCDWRTPFFKQRQAAGGLSGTM